MIHFLKLRSLKHKLILFLIVLIIGPISLNSAVSYYKSIELIEKKSITYMEEIAGQINTTIDTYLQQIDSLSIQTAYSDYIQNLLNKDYDNIKYPSYEYDRDKETAYKYLVGMSKTVDGVENIFVYSKSGREYYGFIEGSINASYTVEGQEWFESALNAKELKFLLGPHQSEQLNITHNINISLVRRIRDLKKLKCIGVIVVDVDINKFREMMKDIGVGVQSDVYIIDREGRIIYDNRKMNQVGQILDSSIFNQINGIDSGSYTLQINKAPYFVTISKSDFSGWNIVTVTAHNDLVKEMSIIRNNTILVTILLVLSAIIFSIIVSDSIVKPIKKLKRMTEEIESGNFDAAIEINGNDEVSSLARSYNRMTGRLKELIQQIYQKENEKRHAEIIALQAQISPHFIYNTLSTIKYMSIIQKSTGITKTVDALINLLQATAKYKDEMITIEEELRLIKSYIYIQETRYCERFLVEFEYEDNLLNCKTLNLILQPIVENAIFHGIGSKAEKLLIKIRICLVSDYVEYMIEDNGPGMSEDRIRNIFLGNITENKSIGGIGINNSNKRIKLCFGEEYGISIQSQPEVGTRVFIKIPIVEEVRKC